MKTITIQIGNSDDKLSQREWSDFVAEVAATVKSLAETVHFFGGAENWAQWQNACWVFTIHPQFISKLSDILASVRKGYKQDSIAWTEGETTFI